MTAFIIKRFLQLIPVALIVSFLAFLMIHLVPGCPVELMFGIEAGRDAIAAERERLGLNLPFYHQYWNFIVSAVRGDLGVSVFTNQPVSSEIWMRYPATFRLALGGTAFAMIVGVIIGIICAVKRGKFMDGLLSVLSLLAVSTPSFFLALVMLLIFSSWLQLLPSFGLATPVHYILPITTLGMQSVGQVARTTRSAMLEVLNQDYIRTSRSRGIPERVVIYWHALKNALIPVVTLMGLRFGGLLAGSALIETVLSINGIGRYMIEAVSRRDFPVVQGTVLVITLTFVVINTLVDILYAFVDPRIKYE